MSRFAAALTGFAVGWLVCLVEYAYTATASGGLFTILMIPVAAGIVSGVCVLASAFVGLLLRLPGIRIAWTKLGGWVICIAIIPIAIIAFSSQLGLRTIEPISGYSVMSSWVTLACYFFIVFPFVNLPMKKEPISTSPPLPQ